MPAFRCCEETIFACHSEEFPWAFGPPEPMKISVVVPAKAGTHCESGERWIPAFAGMTSPGGIFRRAPGDEASRSALENIQSEIPRCARNDKKLFQNRPAEERLLNAAQDSRTPLEPSAPQGLDMR
jgi:hypothetical protein